MQSSLVITPHGKLIEESWQDRLIKKALSSPQGRSSLAAAMANPIRRNLDYQGIARRCLVIDPLPPGALTIFDRDPIEEVGDGSEEE